MKRPRGVRAALFAREADAVSAKRFRAAAYSALVPAATFVNVAGLPNVHFRRFTPCGRYLVSLSRNHRDLVVYRLESGGARAGAPALDFSARPAAPPRRPADAPLRAFAPPQPGILGALPVPLGVAPPALPGAPAPPAPHAPHAPHAPNAPNAAAAERPACHFARFFTQMYAAPVATGSETLVRDFCLCTPRSRFLILASFHADPDAEPPAAAPAVALTPLLHRFTLHLVDVATGAIADRFCLVDDFVPLDAHAGVHMHRDMLLVLSTRQQTIHVLKVQEGLGRFAQEARIGAHCAPDDALVISRARDAEAAYRRKARWRASECDPPAPVLYEPPLDTGLGNGKTRTAFYTGLMQRLLVYVYRRLHAERKQTLFYRVVGQYSMLVMQKAQFLDGDHLLIRLGSFERGGKSDAGASTCFFVVYCVSTTRILNLFENRSAELLAIYERFRDVFVGDAAVAATLPDARPTPPEEDERHERGGALFAARTAMRSRRAALQRTRAALSALPVSCQTRHASPYLDRSLFSYNVDRLPALDGSRALSLRELNAVKFTSVESGGMRFKLAPGMPERDAARARAGGRRKMLFLFHPFLPFVLSMEYSAAMPTLLNFHVYGGFGA